MKIVQKLEGNGQGYYGSSPLYGTFRTKSMTDQQIANVQLWINELRSGKYFDKFQLGVKDAWAQNLDGLTPAGVGSRIVCKKLGLPIEFYYDPNTPAATLYRFPLMFAGANCLLPHEAVDFFGISSCAMYDDQGRCFHSINFESAAITLEKYLTLKKLATRDTLRLMTKKH